MELYRRQFAEGFGGEFAEGFGEGALGKIARGLAALLDLLGAFVRPRESPRFFSGIFVGFFRGFAVFQRRALWGFVARRGT